MCPFTTSFAVENGSIETELNLVGGIYFASISDVDFGTVTNKELGTVIYNKTPLEVRIRDERDEKRSTWKVSVKAEIAQENKGKTYPLSIYTIDGSYAYVFGNGASVDEARISTRKYSSNPKGSDFQEILALKGGSESDYRLVWEVGSLELYLGKDLDVGDYTILTTWQVVNSIE